MADNRPSFTNTTDHTSEFDPADIQTNRVYAILAYIGILVLVPIFAAKDSKFARFHANNGLILLICEAISITTLSILGNIPLVGLLFSILNYLVSIFFTVISIIFLVFAAKGTAKELPLVGKIKILK